MGKKLFVGNLSFNTSDSELRELFSQAGTCESARILTDRETGRSRGFGFVEMSSDEEASRAISEIDGKPFQGRPIRVSEARERSDSRPARTIYPSHGFSQGPPPAPPFRRDGGSRRGLRAKKRSIS